MVGDKWFVKKEEGVFGPVSADDLQNLIKNGRITLDQEASQNETGPWKPLKSYDLFKERPRPIEEMLEDEDESSLDDNLEAEPLVNKANRSQKNQTSSILPSSGVSMGFKKILKICGIFLILSGAFAFIFYVSLMISSYEMSGQEKEEIQGIGIRMCYYAILSVFVGIGSIKLNIIAIYCTIPTCLYGIWIIHPQDAPLPGMIIVVGYLAIIVCSIIYLIQTRSTVRK